MRMKRLGIVCWPVEGLGWAWDGLVGIQLLGGITSFARILRFPGVFPLSAVGSQTYVDGWAGRRVIEPLLYL